MSMLHLLKLINYHMGLAHGLEMIPVATAVLHELQSDRAAYDAAGEPGTELFLLQ